MFVQVHRVNNWKYPKLDTPILLNLEHVSSITPRGKEGVIASFADGGTVRLRETVADIMGLEKIEL